jgi:hypothetical protein
MKEVSDLLCQPTQEGASCRSTVSTIECRTEHSSDGQTTNVYRISVGKVLWKRQFPPFLSKPFHILFIISFNAKDPFPAQILSWAGCRDEH